MNFLLKLRVKYLAALALLVLTANVFAQDIASGTLDIGDSAPEIRYAKWIKGTPVEAGNDDKVYVLEFWATWCVPCRQAMPHLSELAHQYSGKAIFIGCDVLEQTHGATKSLPYDSILVKVERFAANDAYHMSYNVIADTQDQYLAKNWLSAAGENGIPTTFIVKNKRIMWIGHPLDLDKVIEKIISNTYDVDAARRFSDHKKAIMKQRAALMNGPVRTIDSAVAAHSYNKAIALIDQYNVNLVMTSLTVTKFEVLLDHFSEERAISYAMSLEKDSNATPGLLKAIADKILERNNLSKPAYAFAGKVLKQQPATYFLLHQIALAQSKTGNFKSAAATETKAIQLARTEAKDPKFHEITNATFFAYEAALEKYKHLAK